MPEQDDFETAGCAELADELDLFRLQADTDPNFVDTWAEWDAYVVEHTLWLPLEQCCSEGVLLRVSGRLGSQRLEVSSFQRPERRSRVT